MSQIKVNTQEVKNGRFLIHDFIYFNSFRGIACEGQTRRLKVLYLKLFQSKTENKN